MIDCESRDAVAYCTATLLQDPPGASPAPGPRPTYAAGIEILSTLTSSAFAPPPAPPALPVPGALAASPAAAKGRGALLSVTRGCVRLRKAVTNDGCAAPIGGRVVGDTAPPSHIVASTASASTLAPPGYDAHQVGNRQSVDWNAGLAADQSTSRREPSGLNATREVDEDEAAAQANDHVPDIPVLESEPAPAAFDTLDDVNKGLTLRVRTL